MSKIITHKEDWIKLGYKLFSENGIAGIVIEKMSKKLKCNKSSFYWYFKTKKYFIHEIVKFWVETETENIIRLTNQSETAKKKIDTLITITYKKSPYLDFMTYLKRYAIKEKKIQKTIDTIDSQRIKYVKDLLIELGLTDKDAGIKASVFYKHLIGYHEMIRYKKQNKNYVKEVQEELRHFIKY